jgi:hypothetical protein
MIDSAGVSSKLRIRVLAVLMCTVVVAAAQAQVQQPTYPTPNPTYPGQAPAYPAPNQGYPTPAYPAPNQTYPGAGQSYPAQNPAYPNSGYPTPGYPAGPTGYPQSAQPCVLGTPPKSHFVRDLFAQTIAAVLQAVTGGLAGAIGGSIMNWFARKSQTQSPGYYPAAGYNPAPGYAATPGYAPTPGYPAAGYAGAAQYPNPACIAQNAYPGAANPSMTQAYPQAATGYPAPTTAYPNSGAQYPNAAATAQAYPQAATGYPAPSTAYANSGALYPSAAATAQAYPQAATGYPAAATAYPNSGAQYPGAPTPNAAYPGNAYPAPNYQSATAANSSSGTQVYDAQTGQLVTGPSIYTSRGTATESSIYAGIAYEVDSVGADGQLTPVNTATYEFHTGDKFKVYYRPSLPGHMEIYNVNPKGQQTLIDSSNMAAGQMVELGPYQFTNLSGDETLHLVLSPCSSPQLLAATRDIVRMDASPQTAPQAPGVPTMPVVNLASCGAPTPRGLDIHTRDIEKIAVDGTTSFALDPLSHQEMSSGQVTPREATIVFHHR